MGNHKLLEPGKHVLSAVQPMQSPGCGAEIRIDEKALLHW